MFDVRPERVSQVGEGKERCWKLRTPEVCKECKEVGKRLGGESEMSGAG